jgi:hypothetical protein
MAHCPFCDGSIDEDLARFGGPCPHCFCEIPGDEAATDPGEEVKAQQEAAIQRRAAARRSVPLLLAVPVVLGAVAIALFVALRPEPEPVALNLDDAEYWQQGLEDLMVITGSATEEEDSEPAVASAGRPASGKTPTAASGASDDPMADAVASIKAPSAGDQLGGGTRTVAVGGGGAEPKVDITQGAAGGSSNPFAELSFTVQRKREKGVRLTNDNDIVEMVKAVVATETPKLQSCYDRRLKLRTDLAGAWQLRFTVTSDGNVDNPRAVGQNVSDEELEQCIADKLESWQFQPIKADLPVQRTIRFRPT